VRRLCCLGAVLALAIGVQGIAAGTAGAAAPCTKPVAGGDWPMAGHDLSNTRTQPDEHGIGPDAVTGLQPAWVFSTQSTGDDTGFESTPVVANGCVFVGSFGGFAYALDAGDGHVVWQRKLEVSKAGFGGVIVGAPVMYGSSVIYLVDQEGAPYAIALNRSTGAVVWQSQPFAGGHSTVLQGYYTNASPIVANGLVLAGYSPSEGDSKGTGGFALIDAGTGTIVKTTPTIPLEDQAKGYAGGGLWSTPGYDPTTGYAYFPAGNPSNKGTEHPNTNSILKIDLNRSSATFGEIAGAYKGNVDQYTKELQTLSQTPACQASDVPNMTWPADDPACGQIDLDFGGAANLFTTSDGTKAVGDLQKSGVYHAADRDTMKPLWTSLVSVSCAPCNGAAAAVTGASIVGISTPATAGLLYSLSRDTGARNWIVPIGDHLHFGPTTVADGVAWIADDTGNLDAYDANTGVPLLRRPMAEDAHAPVTNITSTGVSVAEHTVFAAAGGLVDSPTTGYVIAYRPAG
jgi:polyvinyl alcohol dehydrogenase (cytochrome)